MSRTCFVTATVLPLLLLVGCYDDTTPATTFTRDQARAYGGVDPDTGDDICATHDWYGDGVCDMFCPEPDPDCTECPDPLDPTVWYASTDPEECTLLDFACPEGAEYFGGSVAADCGCGCTGVTPPPTCEPVLCEIACEYGFERDERGCEICRCAPPPACEPLTCDIAECEFGRVRDERGCETCECNPGPTCPPVLCDLACEHGFARNEDGCEICECAPPPTCEPVACTLACEHGFARGEDGCEICECHDPSCPSPDDPRVRYVGDSPEECAVIFFGCREGEEYFGGECGCGCISDRPAECHDPDDPRVTYVGDSPGECELIDFACAGDEEYFADACGCGCLSAREPCDAMDADMVGGCEPAPVYWWNGRECVGESGCECVGADCDDVFPSEAACEEAHVSCGGTMACYPMDAHAEGGCEPAPFWVWNGATCVAEVGCRCVGEDCDSVYSSQRECRRDNTECREGCPPADDPRVSYVAESPDECAVIDFDCFDDGWHFSGPCGCGCISH